MYVQRMIETRGELLGLKIVVFIRNLLASGGLSSFEPHSGANRGANSRGTNEGGEINQQIAAHGAFDPTVRKRSIAR